jgi:hypothetical protein
MNGRASAIYLSIGMGLVLSATRARTTMILARTASFMATMRSSSMGRAFHRENQAANLSSL